LEESIVADDDDSKYGQSKLSIHLSFYKHTF